MAWKRDTGTCRCPWQSRRLECTIKRDRLRQTWCGRTCYWWCPRTLCSLCPHNLNSSLHWFRYITDSEDTAPLCALLLNIKKLKKFWGYAGPITWEQVFVMVYVALNRGSEHTRWSVVLKPSYFRTTWEMPMPFVYHYWSAVFSDRNMYSIILPLTVKYLKTVWNSNLNKTWGSKNQINVIMRRMCQFRESFQHSSL